MSQPQYPPQEGYSEYPPQYAYPQQQQYPQQPYPQQPYSQQPYPPQGQYNMYPPPDNKPSSSYGDPDKVTGPGSTAVLVGEENGRFKPGGYQDVWAALLYLADLVAFIAVSAYSIKSVFGNNKSTTTSPSTNFKGPSNSVYGILGGSAVFAFMLSVGYLIAMRRFPRQLILFTFWFSIMLYALLAVLGVFTRNISLTIICIILVIFYLVTYRAFKSRMPFASVMLSTVASITQKFPATITAGVVGLIVSMVFNFFWVISIVSIYATFAPEETTDSRGRHVSSGSSGPLYVLLIFGIFSYYWTNQVMKNVVHVTISGTFATFYFLSGSPQGLPNNPTAGSFKRAITTSFGSICFGSLIIALLQTLRAILRSIRNDSDGLGAFVACCMECILAWIEGLVQYFNHYAFTQVAIYGKDYWTAAKSTWKLIKDRGIDAIINDDLIGNVLGFGGLLVGFLNVAFVYIIAAIIGITQSTSSDYVWIISLCILAFLLGVVMFFLIGEVINSGVATTFVCLAEDPEALRATKPELWEKIRETYPQAALQSMNV